MRSFCVAAALLLAAETAFAQEELSAKERSKLESAKSDEGSESVLDPISEPAPAPVPATTAKPSEPEGVIAPKGEEPAAPAGVAKPAPESAGVATAAATPAVAVEPDPAEAKPAPVVADMAEDAGELVPLPVAIISAVLETCMPTLRGERALDAGLPDGTESGITEPTLERFIASPQPGDYWTVPTLEGPMLLGNLHQREGACQVMGSTPLGEVVMDKITTSLGELDTPFTLSDETGDDFGTPIHWRRFMSADRDYVDVLHYKGVPGGMASTIHVIVG